MRSISDIIKDGGSKLEALLREAFEAGVVAGRDDVRRQLEGFFTAPVSLGVSRTSTAISVGATTAHRAAPGTVKPTILHSVAESNLDGVTTEGLIVMTGFKPNSVRGTVSTLQSEGSIRRIGDRWFATPVAELIEHQTNKGGVE